jgi:DNA polymerase-3 subunit epsilon
MNFTSIDFETANNTKAGICAAGVAVFEDDKLVESLYWLVRPPKGCGWFLEEFTKNCHGLTWFDVQNAPEFSTIAPEILARLIRADIVIAHNAAFDMRKLRGTLEHFGFACPAFDVLCTLKLSRCPPPSFSDRRPVLPAGCFPVRSPYAGWKSKLFPPFRFGSFVLRWCKCLR